MAREFKLRLGGEEFQIEQVGRSIRVNGHGYEPRVSGDSVTIGDVCHRVEVAGAFARVDGISYAVETEGLHRQACRRASTADDGPAGAPGALTAIMPGLIIKVLVSPGDHVAAGDVTVVLEAMKMENEICSPKEGTVREVRVRSGESVQQNQVLVVIE